MKSRVMLTLTGKCVSMAHQYVSAARNFSQYFSGTEQSLQNAAVLVVSYFPIGGYRILLATRVPQKESWFQRDSNLNVVSKASLAVFRGSVLLPPHAVYLLCPYFCKPSHFACSTTSAPAGNAGILYGLTLQHVQPKRTALSSPNRTLPLLISTPYSERSVQNTKKVHVFETIVTNKGTCSKSSSIYE